MKTLPAAVEQLSRRRTPLLCALGDSWSAGVGDRVIGAPARSLRDPLGCGWPAHLAALLGAELLNLGRNGARARDVLATQLPTALAARPELATVLIGGNDVLRGDYDADEVRDALTATVAGLLGRGIEVVLVVPPQIGAGQPAPAAVRRVLARRMEQVRRVVREVGEQLAQVRLITIDADPVRGLGPGVLHIDRIHPSPLGHRLLAEHIGVTMSARGWPLVGRVEQPPPPPGLVLQAAWLAMCGVPWLAKRSRDLLPEIVRVVLAEERAQPRRRTGGLRRSARGSRPTPEQRDR